MDQRVPTHLNEYATLSASAAELRQWMHNTAFPLWLEQGRHPTGLAWEALDLNGHPQPGDLTRIRVQARQLFVAALAHRLGWQPESALTLVRGIFNLLEGTGRREDGLYGRVFSYSTSTLTDSSYCLYDTAFVLLACAKARPLIGSNRVDPLVSSILASLDDIAAHPEGGYFEEALEPGTRLQNHHMHLFESLLALRDAGFSEDIEIRIDLLRSFIATTFMDPDRQVVHERIDGGLPDGNDSEITFEPGHSMEWVWLLAWHAGYRAEQLDPFALALYQRAVSSLDAQGQACATASLSGGKPDPSQLLWPQTESLKAHLCMAQLGEPEQQKAALELATKTCRRLSDFWLSDVVEGGWRNHFDTTNRLISTTMPASTGYHLFGAIAELDRIVPYP